MATSAAHIDYDEGAAPATPGASKVRLYAKTDGLLYSKDDAGTETLVSGGAGGGGSGDLTVVRKSANEVVNASTTLQDDDHLHHAVGANEVYEFELQIWFDASTAADLKYTFTVPAGATLRFTSSGLAVGASAYNEAPVVTASGTTSTQEAQGVGTIRHFRVMGFVANGANAGNLQFQWAQNSSSATDTTIHANSTLKVYQLA